MIFANIGLDDIILDRLAVGVVDEQRPGGDDAFCFCIALRVPHDRLRV